MELFILCRCWVRLMGVDGNVRHRDLWVVRLECGVNTGDSCLSLRLAPKKAASAPECETKLDLSLPL